MDCIHSHSDFSLERSEEDSGKDTMGLSGSKKKKKKSKKGGNQEEDIDKLIADFNKEEKAKKKAGKA